MVGKADTNLIMLALKAAMDRRDRAGINAQCERLIAVGARIGSQWKSVITLLQYNGEHILAERAARIWVQESGAGPTATFEHAAVLANGGRAAEAIQVLQSVPEDFPSRAANLFTKGTVSLNLGRLAEARDALREAARAEPRSGQCWLALAMSGPVSDEDAVLLLAAGPAMRSSSPSEQGAWQYAVSKLHSDRRQHSAAFTALDEGAALMRSQRRYDRVSDESAAQAAKAGWSKATIAAASVPTDGLAPPIFVTGLPRSGTTLVEQILTSHSAVSDGAELGLYRLLEQDIGGKSYQAFEHYPGGGEKLRALYRHLLAQRFPDCARIVDKTLNASRYIGLLAALFPDSPILWVRRDPLDCAWSAYRTWFLRGVDWSWSLSDIAHHFRIEDDLFHFWTAMLGERILAVDYDRLVCDPVAQIELMTRHCGLEPEEGQLAPHLTERSVITASVEQVRSPIHRASLGAAEPYRQWLGPFLDAYR